jgi:AMIN domain
MPQHTRRAIKLLILLVLSGTTLALAEDRLKVGALDILFTSEKNGVQLLQISGPPLESEIAVRPSLVDNPTRIVVDFTPSIGSSVLSGRYRLESAICARIRIGVDERKTRIVLDCDDLKIPGRSLDFQVDKSGQTVSVRFIAPSLATITSTTNSTSSSTSSSSTSTTTTSTSTTTILKGSEAGSNKNELLRLAFVSHNSGEGAILLEFKSPGDYLLLKGSDGRTTFSMTKAGYSAKHLRLEQFAPDTVKGLLALVPNSTSDSLSMTIFLEPGFTLQGEWSGSILYLRAKK